MIWSTGDDRSRLSEDDRGHAEFVDLGHVSFDLDVLSFLSSLNQVDHRRSGLLGSWVGWTTGSSWSPSLNSTPILLWFLKVVVVFFSSSFFYVCEKEEEFFFFFFIFFSFRERERARHTLDLSNRSGEFGDLEYHHHGWMILIPIYIYLGYGCRWGMCRYVCTSNPPARSSSFVRFVITLIIHLHPRLQILIIIGRPVAWIWSSIDCFFRNQ